MRAARGRIGGSGAKSVGDLLPNVLDRLGVFGGLRSERVAAAWAEAAGTEISSHTRALRLRGTTLIVEVDSAARLQELRNFTGEALRRRANRLLGEPLVEKILFRFSAGPAG